MSVCIFGSSALDFMRSSGRLAPEFLERPRTQKLDGCGVPPATMLADEMTRVGVKTKPVHILVSAKTGDRSRGDIVCHRCAGDLPARALVRLSEDVLVTSPALTFLHLAAEHMEVGGVRDVEDLAMIGFELCGTYLLDASWDGFTTIDAPLTSTEQIRRLLDSTKGMVGQTRAREALELVRDGSHSPMESVLCALLTWPRRLGGYAFGPVALNCRVATQAGERYVDVAFPEKQVGLEYKGRRYHAIERAGRDDRRQNKLVGSGWTILNVWHEDLLQENLFGQLVSDLARAMGVRLRIRSAGFEARCNLLRQRLVPALAACAGLTD